MAPGRVEEKTPTAVRVESVESPSPIIGDCNSVGPFLLGTAIGGVAGAVAGTMLSDRTRRLLVALIRLAGRRLSDAERDELRFELLLQ